MPSRKAFIDKRLGDTDSEIKGGHAHQVRSNREFRVHLLQCGKVTGEMVRSAGEDRRLGWAHSQTNAEGAPGLLIGNRLTCASG